MHYIHVEQYTDYAKTSKSECKLYKNKKIQCLCSLPEQTSVIPRLFLLCRKQRYSEVKESSQFIS